MTCILLWSKIFQTCRLIYASSINIIILIELKIASKLYKQSNISTKKRINRNVLMIQMINSRFHHRSWMRSIEVNEMALAIDDVYPAGPFGQILDVEFSLYVLLIHLFHILWRNIEKSIGLIGQASLDQPIMTLAHMLQIDAIVIPGTELRDLPKCNGSDGMRTHIGIGKLCYPLAHLNHGCLLLRINMSFFADFEDDVFGLDGRYQIQVLTQDGVHLLVDVSPLFQGYPEFTDYVEFLEVVLFQEADCLKTVSCQKSHCKDVFVLVTLTFSSFLLLVIAFHLSFFAFAGDLTIEGCVDFALLVGESLQNAGEHGCCFAAKSLAEPQSVSTVINILFSSEKIALKISTLYPLIFSRSLKGSVDLRKSIHNFIFCIISIDIVFVGERTGFAEVAFGVGTDEVGIGCDKVVLVAQFAENFVGHDEMQNVSLYN